MALTSCPHCGTAFVDDTGTCPAGYCPLFGLVPGTPEAQMALRALLPEAAPDVS